MTGRSAEIDNFTARPTSIAYQTGGNFEVSFDNGTSLVATRFPEQLVAAAYWFRGEHFLQVEFDPSSSVIHRIGEFLSDRPFRRAAPGRPIRSRKPLDPGIQVCISAVATQVGSPSSIFELFTDHGNFRTTDPVLAVLVETALMRGRAPHVTVSGDMQLLGMTLPADAAACRLPPQFSNVGDIIYQRPDASVTAAPDAIVFRTNDPVIIGVLATARAIGEELQFFPFPDDPSRIQRVMSNSSSKKISGARSAASGTTGCLSSLATDIDDSGNVFLTLTADVLNLGITYDPLIQILSHGALVGILLVGAEADDANRVVSFTVSHLGRCD